MWATCLLHLFTMVANGVDTTRFLRSFQGQSDATRLPSYQGFFFLPRFCFTMVSNSVDTM